MSFIQRNTAILRLVLLAFVVLAGTARAGETKYPPYPDIWGREAPVPNGVEASLVSLLYRNPDGDRLIKFSWESGDSTTAVGERERRTVAFFSGDVKELNKAQSERIFRNFEEADVDEIVYQNGDVIKTAPRTFAAPRCGSNYNHVLVKKNKAGKVLLSKILFLLYERPKRTGIWEHCSLAGGKDTYSMYADSQYLVLEPLEDGTFLGRLYAEKFVVRFKPDLTSPFVGNERLFIVDTAVIDQLVEEAYARPGQAIQNANDAIRDYLLTLKKGD